MATADITTTVEYWPIRTREEIDSSAWELFDELDGYTAHTIRGYDQEGHADVRLQIVSPAAGLVLDAAMGGVIVKGPSGWERITADEANQRGLTLPTP